MHARWCPLHFRGRRFKCTSPARNLNCEMIVICFSVCGAAALKSDRMTSNALAIFGVMRIEPPSRCLMYDRLYALSRVSPPSRVPSAAALML